MTVKKRPAWDAKIPNISRNVVPELPASKTSTGSSKLSKPIPLTRTNSVFKSETSAPIAWKQLAVLRGSSPKSNPSIRVSPSASAPSINARWEIDLSPGTRILPFKDSPDSGRRTTNLWGRFCLVSTVITEADIRINWRVTVREIIPKQKLYV